MVTVSIMIQQRMNAMPPERFMPACATGCSGSTLSPTAGATLVLNSRRSTPADAAATSCAELARSMLDSAAPQPPSSKSSVTAPVASYADAAPAARAAASAAVAPGCATSAAWKSPWSTSATRRVSVVEAGSTVTLYGACDAAATSAPPTTPPSRSSTARRMLLRARAGASAQRHMRVPFAFAQRARARASCISPAPSQSRGRGTWRG